jgi:broad specificity phosphatase PhoE
MQGKVEPKWPSELILVRHDVSAYNQMKTIKAASHFYKRFKELKHLGKDNPEAQAAATLAWEDLRVGASDHATPLANGRANAFAVGQALREREELPDVIFVSPYLRTKDTLGQLIAGWPELGGVRVYEEERVREHEHGLMTLYNDSELFFFFHPEQRLYHDMEGGRYWYRFVQGENVPDVRERVRSFTTTLVRDLHGKKVLVVTHHLCILAFRANLERLDAQQFLDLDSNEAPINCGVTRYRCNPHVGKAGHLELVSYNERLY